MELPACPEVSACHSEGTSPVTVCRPDPGLLPGVFCFQWADTANRYLEAIGCPEPLDLRSYARQGIDKIPTVHMGAAVCQMEKRGIQTDIGNLNRDIKAANSLMQSIRQMVRHLKS